MRFEYIELRGYRRFDLAQITTFKMTMTAMTQLILGTNGSGKSSLMEQLSVLPPNPADFKKGGGKIIKVEHRGHRYTLSSDFSNKNHPHSFIIDDKEDLNEGGTVTVQRGLVKKHFGVTQEIQDMISGNLLFTDLPAPKRKEWLIALCDTNFDFAISVYNKFKEMHRDIVGARKILKNRLVAESEKLVSEDTVATLKVEIQELHEFLTKLIELRRPVDAPMYLLEHQQEDVDRDLYRLAKQLNRIADELNATTATTQDCERKLSELEKEFHSLSGVVQEQNKVHRSNADKIRVLQQTNQQSVEAFEADVKGLEEQLKELELACVLPNRIEDGAAALQAFSTIRSSLTDVFTYIPINPIGDDGQRKYSQQKNAAYKSALDECRRKQNNLTAQIQRLEERVDHMVRHKDRKDATCPQCDHSFSLSYSQKEHDGYVQTLEQLRKNLKPLKEEEAQLVTFLEECGEYGVYARQYYHLFKDNPVLKDVDVWLREREHLGEEPRAGLYSIPIVEAELLRWAQAQDIRKKMAEKTRLLESLRQVGSADLTTLLAEQQTLDDSLGEASSRLRQIANEKNQLTSLKARLQERGDLVIELKQKIKENKQLLLTKQETLRREHFNALIQRVQSELASKEKIVGTAAMQAEVVKNITDEAHKLQTEEQDLAVLIKQLSPTEGLIAEGLLGFVKNFVDQMNQIIQKVWSYDMVIKTCEVVEGESIDMDYKFPVAVHTHEKPVPDISNTSTGMREIINIAFRLTAMHYLGMHDFPLYLDEAGAGFDPAHRVEFARMLHALMEQNSFSQTFLISHYYDVYGGLSNYEACVLSTLNISPPAGYNSHVEIG